MPDSVRVPAHLRPITAAAIAYTPDQFRSGSLFLNQSWQLEGWGFRRTLGEYSQAIDWMSRAMSRVRLTAAEVTPGGDEPEALVEGAAADLMNSFCGGGPGHSAFLKAITPHLLVPGEGWLVAERTDPSIPLAAADWGVYATQSIRPRGNSFQVQVGQSVWRDLLSDNLPMRIFDPDPQYPWLATSNTEAAIPIMRRIYLIDSRIIATMVSRLAMNGLMLIPEEGTIGVPAQYKDAPDPFVALLVDTASKNIANPGNASAAIPIPVKFAGKLIEQWKILKADDPLPQELVDERAAELGRLADTLAIARERVTGGMGQQNHWSGWQSSEEETRITFAPLAELIVGAVTKTYLVPMLTVSGQSLVGPNGGKIIAWYDTSELTAQPDKSAAAVLLYDRLELSGEALRRDSGFDESDAPTDEELTVMVWKKAVTAGNADLDVAAVRELTGVAITPPPAVSERATIAPVGEGAAVSPAAGKAPGAAGPIPAAVPAAGTMPSTRAVPPPAPGRPAAAPVAASAVVASRPPGRRRYQPRHTLRR